MQLKNNLTANLQFNYRKNIGKMVTYHDEAGNKITKPEKPKLAMIHIPGGATVEIDDDVYNELLKGKTEVQQYIDVTNEIEDAEIKMDKHKLSITERQFTGKTKEVNLFNEAIKCGDLSIVEKPVVNISKEQMLKEIHEAGVNMANNAADKEIALVYEKLFPL
ncbi:MAG: hypothetical protein EKE20_14695 [Candidatus Symbiopectobacterium sp. Dall1.0]|nr:hypothetical protein [Candidatus Symbiopectobacterium sp. Dall1.0]